MSYIRIIVLSSLLFFLSDLSASTQVKWKAVSAGWYHTIAIDHNGDLWAWGSNSSGQLGVPSLSEAQDSNPHKIFIDEKPQVKWLKVFAGPYSSFALDTDGVLWAWGANRYSTLGINQSSTVILAPTKVDNFYEEDGVTLIDNVVINNVQAASYGTIATTESGQLFVWGRNNDKQLFDVTVTVDDVEIDVTEIKAPRLKDDTANWIDIAAADGNTRGGYFAINDLGEAYFFGENEAGLSGTGINGGILTELTEITHPESTANIKKKWVEVAAGKYKAVAIDELGYAMQWGDNVISPVNVPLTTGYFKPFDAFTVSPESLPSESESLNDKVQVRTNFQGILDKHGDLYFWGLNKFYTTSSDKFFSGSNEALKYEESVEKWNKVERFAIQERSVIIVNDKRDIFAHGSNSAGQLGLQSAYSLSSSYSKLPQAWLRWSKVVAGAGVGHSLAIVAKDVCYKDNPNLNTLSYTFNPADYNADICPKKEEINDTFSVGPIWGWGDNSYNQLTSTIIDPSENTEYIDKPSPLIILDENYERKQDWIDIVSAGNHALALDVNGNLYAWGVNHFGQLGLGHTNNVSSATKLPMPNGFGVTWKSVSTSESHTLAIDSDGKLWAWGNNSENQLGLTSNSLVPQQIGISDDWKVVVAADGYSLALNATGQRFAWGKNSNEELGDSGLNSAFDEPTLVDSAWLMIAASNGYSFGIKSNNKVYFWGAQAKKIVIGDNFEIVNVETPEQFESVNEINNVSSWRQIVSDGNSNFALTSEGQLWAWGNNVNAQSGAGFESSFEYEPLQVLSEYAYTQVDTSSKHSLGISNYSVISGWGYNEQAQTGSPKVFGETYVFTPKDIFLTDRDGDGAFDHIDLYVDDPRFTVDTDGDGIVDELDDDSDNDGISDADERAAGLNPFDASDASQDSDLDGMTNLEELTIYNTCNHVTDSECSLRQSVPGPLNLSYIQNSIYNSALDTALLNRRYFSFVENEFTQDYAWASQPQIENVELFIEENTSLSPNTGIENYTKLLDVSEGYDGNQSLKLTNVNRSVTFNSVFKTDEFANPTVRKLLPGSVFFSFKFSDTVDPTEDKIVISLRGMPGSGITDRAEIWSSSSQDEKSIWHVAKFDLTSSHLVASESFLSGFAQLSWKLVCSTSCEGKTVNLDTLSFPIDINENGIPAEYRKLAANGSASSDSDSDGLNNLNEYLLGTNPINTDTDLDGLSDYKESLPIGSNGSGTDPLNNDSDGDGITDGREFFGNYKQGIIIKTDPLKVDTDGDGLSDREEQDGATISVESVNVIVLSDPTEIHSDTDGISDNEELCLTVVAEEIPNCIKTNPSANDTDGDGIDDEVEINGFNIVVNGIEILVTSNPTLKDSNNDGLEDGFKKLNNLDPKLDDTDGDGLSDFDELNTYKTDPSMSDSDDDGIADNVELCLDAAGIAIPNCITSNPINSDTDGDGLIDGKDSNVKVSTRYVYLDNNKNGAIEVPFVETSVAYGRQILSLVDVTTGKKAEVNGVVQEFHIPSWFTADSAKVVRNSNKDNNPNTLETNDVVLAGNTSDGKRAWVIIDGASGKLFQSLAFPSWFTPLEMQVVPDVTGNFKDEVLMFGSTSDNKRVWMSHDTGTRTEISRVVYPSWFTPSELVIVPDTTKYDVFTYGVKTDNNYAHFVNGIKPSTQKAALKQSNEVKTSKNVNRVDEQGNLGVVLHEVMSDNTHQITTKLARGYTAVNGYVPSINAVKLASGWQFEHIVSFDDSSNEAALSKFATIESKELASKQLTVRNPDLSVLKVVQLQNTSSYDNSFDFSEGYDWKILSNLNLQSMVNIPDFDGDEIDDILISGTSQVNGEEVNILIVYSSSATQKPLKLHNMYNLKSLH